MNVKISDVLEALQTYGEPEIVALLDGLNPLFSLVPVDALLRLATAAGKAADAKSELEAMQAAVLAADAVVDAGEVEALKASAK